MLRDTLVDIHLLQLCVEIVSLQNLEVFGAVVLYKKEETGRRDPDVTAYFVAYSTLNIVYIIFYKFFDMCVARLWCHFPEFFHEVQPSEGLEPIHLHVMQRI